MSDKELGFWLLLNAVKGVGAKRYNSLLEAFGSPRAVFGADRDQLLQVKGMTPTTVTALLQARAEGGEDGQLSELRRIGVTVLTIHGDDYPPLLRTIFDPPPVLFCRGTVEALTGVCVAIVGSRHCTAAGRMIASSMARELSNLDFVVVSGLARGIDTAAHRGALAGSGRTVAVLGCGIDVVYPPENADLLREVASRGAVISEFNPGTKPLPGNFPARNRIISGLCEGTVLVEAGAKSGALITADFAMEHNREVMAVPGSPLNAMAIGPNRLLKQGAGLVENASDVCSCLGLYSQMQSVKRAAQEPPWDSLNPTAKAILRCLTLGPMGADELVSETGLAPQEVLSSLTSLHLSGRVVEHRGRVFSLPVD